MIYLKKLQIKNFQKHSDLTLEFTSGVNILYGQSGSGKSCIRRAIEFLHGASLKNIRKEGTKETSVKGWYSNNIILERVRSASINRYILNDGKGLVSTFDAIGKEIPEEIKNLLPFYNLEIEDEEINLNFATQISLPFLFDKSPTTRMKLFNKLSGNEIIDKLFVQFNKDILGIGRNIKEYKEKSIIQEKEVQEKEAEKEQIEYKYEKLKKIFNNLELLQDKYSKLLSLNQLYKNNVENIELISKTLMDYKIPQLIEIKRVIELIDKNSLLNAFNLNASNIIRVEDELKQSELPEVYIIEETKVKNERLTYLKSILEEMDKNFESFQALNLKQENEERQLEILEQEKSKFKICDKCEGIGYLNV